MIRYLAANMDTNAPLWDEICLDRWMRVGDEVKLPNGTRYKIMFVEGRAFNGKREVSA